LLRAAERFSGLILAKEQVTVLAAPKPVEDRIIGLQLGMHLLGVTEETGGFREIAGLVE